MFQTPPSEWHDLFAEFDAQPGDWREAARRGGYPMPAVELASAAEREIWFDGFVRTYLERDLHAGTDVTPLADRVLALP